MCAPSGGKGACGGGKNKFPICDKGLSEAAEGGVERSPAKSI